MLGVRGGRSGVGGRGGAGQVGGQANGYRSQESLLTPK